MKGKYIKPSELLKLQKETGKSYWDLIGRPLGKKPKDPAKDVIDEYDPVQREALRMQIESALDYPQYKGGKSPKIKTWNDNDIADLIIGFEGFLPHAKDIGDGKITIGSGLTNPKYTRFGTITPEQNRRFVLEEIAARKARLSRNVPGWNTLPGSAKAALLSYDYGYMVDRKTSPKMMKALQDRNWLEVSNQMNAGWNMKKFKKGLRKRRTQERNLFLSDLYRPAPLKPIQTISPIPEAKVPFEVNQMEDKIAPIVNQQQPIVPYTSTVELQQEYTIPENDMASIDLENTSRIKPNDILQSYYNMFGYKRGKSFPFQFWNRADNTMRLQRFYRGKNKHDWQWTRVKQTNGKYGYVKTRDDRPIEFSTTTGKFRVYDSPDSNARSFETVKDNAQVTNKQIGIQRTPDDHNAALERDRTADETTKNKLDTGISDLFTYAKNYISNQIDGQNGDFIDLSNDNVSRITSDTKNINSILANEFVENNNNTIRKKKDFINTNDTLLGDRKIPLSNISTYYGIENGKLKAGPISIFNDTTTIIPNRIKRLGKIKKLLLVDPQEQKKYNEQQNKIIDDYVKRHNYKPSFFDYIQSGIFFKKPTSSKILISNEGREALNRVVNENIASGKLKLLFDKVITENGDTININKTDFNASPKVLFADENGNSIFVSMLKGRNINKVNNFLSKNPAYPIMVDNGRYSSHLTNFPTVRGYAGLGNPDTMYILGTTRK